MKTKTIYGFNENINIYSCCIIPKEINTEEEGMETDEGGMLHLLSFDGQWFLSFAKAKKFAINHFVKEAREAREAKRYVISQKRMV